MRNNGARWILLFSVTSALVLAVVLASSATGRTGSAGHDARSAKIEKWVGAGISGLDQHKHRDTGGDPKTQIVSDDDQAYHAWISFKFTIDGSSIEGSGTGEYRTATWHLEGTNGDKGDIGCDPVITAKKFTVKVSGKRTNGSIDLNLSYPDAEESNVDTPCGADYTAHGGTTTRLADSLGYIGGSSLKFTSTQFNVNLSKPENRAGGDYPTWTVDHYLDLSIEPHQLFSKEDKDKLARSAQDMNIAAAYWLTLQAKCPSCIFAGLGSAAYYFLGSINGRLALDPPRARFRKIEKPHFPRFAKVRAQGNLNQGGADRVNALFGSEAKVAGYGGALVTSLERSGGAKVAKNARWKARQLRAARSYSGNLASAIETYVRRAPQTRSALEASGFNAISVLPADFRALQEQTKANGLPSWLSADLKSLGVDASVRKEIRATILATDPNDVARLGTFPAMLTDAQTLAALRNSAAVLRRFSQHG